ncbi:hypothetical protein BJ166DRAFT_587926 [Pestalotiopsis sp. NC0098]|nr:hypothetical protein BJ166DRAFT_587926 [Pestalotiopsis sp. NC0098]
MQFSMITTLAFAALSNALAAPRQVLPTVYQPCGGFVQNPQSCQAGYQCIEPDPRRPEVTDLPGICVPDEPTTCTGPNQCVSVTFLTQCYDWPLDGCDPENGDQDCIGLCLDPIPSSSSYPVKGY